MSKKITGPGSFIGFNGSPAVTCSYKAAQGFIYPLERGFIYIYKPPIFIRYLGNFYVIGQIFILQYMGSNLAIRSHCRQLTSNEHATSTQYWLLAEDTNILPRYDDIRSVVFERSGGSTRSFDISVLTLNDQTYTFSSIEKGEYGKLYEFIKSKKISVKTSGTSYSSFICHVMYVMAKQIMHQNRSLHCVKKILKS